MQLRLVALRKIALLGAVVLTIAACGGGNEAGADSPATTAPEATSESTTTGASPAEVSVSHNQGESTVPFQPERVVVFEYAALDTLDYLRIDVNGVVQGTLPEHLQEYAGDDYTNVGSLFEPDYETINSLDPDLVIVGGRSTETYPEMVENGWPTIDLTYDWEDPLSTVESNTETIGQIFGVEDQTDTVLEEIRADIEAVKAAAEQSDKTALIVMTSAGEVTAFGPGSRFGIVHDVFGVAPAIEDVEAATHGDAISFEFILEANPDILYVIDRDAAIGQEGTPAQEVLDNEIVHQTTAWQHDDVHFLDGGAWYLSFGGLTSTATMIQQIRASVE